VERHEIRERSERLIVRSCRRATLGCPVLQVPELHALEARLDGVEPSIEPHHIMVVLLLRSRSQMLRQREQSIPIAGTTRTVSTRRLPTRCGTASGRT
jgi:hypothetical protein